MTISTVNLPLRPYGKESRKVVVPVDGGSHLRAGTLVSQLNATAALVPGSTAASGAAVGVSVNEVDNTSGADGAKRAEILTDGIFVFNNGTAGDACSEATPLFSIVYMGDDHTIFDNSNGSTLQPAGRFCGMEDDGRVRVFVGMSNLGDAINSAALVTIADSGGFTTAGDVEAALAEIYQNIESTKALLSIPLNSFCAADATPLAKFASAASPTFGLTLADSESLAIRWNNDANPGTAICQVALPLDLDDTANAELEFLCSKSGATVGDATTLTVAAFIIAVGDLHDADANCGSVTNALVGNATAKTTALLTCTLAAADIPAGARNLFFSVTPTAGLLGTDDLMIHAVNLRYKRKILTS